MPHVARSGGQVLTWVGQTRYSAARVVEEVTEAINKRMQRRLARADRLARCLRELASHAPQVMASDLDEMRSGPWFPGFYRELMDLCRTMKRFDSTITSFIAEHRALVDDKTLNTVEALRRWCDELPARLEPAWSEYLRNVDAGLDACAGEYEAAASEWSATDTDGWPDEPET